MVRSYAKGYSAERELLHTLSRMGYMTIRAPRSGSISLASPDVIAIKDGKMLVFEVKWHESAFTIRPEQLAELEQWSRIGGATAYVACKISRKGWKFLTLDDVTANRGNVGKKFLAEKGMPIESLTS